MVPHSLACAAGGAPLKQAYVSVMRPKAWAKASPPHAAKESSTAEVVKKKHANGKRTRGAASVVVHSVRGNRLPTTSVHRGAHRGGGAKRASGPLPAPAR